MVRNSNLGGTILEGSDTTSASTQYIILCATAFPDKQQKVFEELERVIGPNRVPRLEDMDSLPYTRAFAEEVCVDFSSEHFRRPELLAVLSLPPCR